MQRLFQIGGLGSGQKTLKGTAMSQEYRRERADVGGACEQRVREARDP
jgi:hypothetical protein